MATPRWPLLVAASTVVAAGILFGAVRLLAFVQPVMDASDVVYYGRTFDRAGADVARAGDVNGDGFADFLVGAPWAIPEGGERVGRVYLLLGRPDIAAAAQEQLLENADASFLGEYLNAETGTAVSAAGDVNDDGLDDFLIGARKASPTTALDDAGKVYLVLGRASADWGQDFDLAGADASFVGDTADDGAGSGLAGARDVNGDGLDDFLIGAQYADGAAEGAGKAALFLGRRDADWGQGVPLADADASFLGVWQGDYTGRELAGVGDVNADGLADIVIGAHGSDTDGNSAGTAYLVFGRSAADWGSAFSLSGADTRFVSESPSSFAGWSVAGVGDASGDGVPDILIGAPNIDEPLDNCGKVYLVLGRRGDAWPAQVPLADADASWVGAVSAEKAGVAAAAAGDVNGDGLGDLAFGAENHQGGGPDGSGRVYVVLGRPSGWRRDVSLAVADSAVNISVLEGAFISDDFGTTVAGVGDVDRDGFSDVVAGAPGFSDPDDHHGAAFLVRGRGLDFAKRAAAPIVAPGSTTSFVMRYTNTMRTALRNAAVVDQVPQGLGFVSCHGGITCTLQGRRVIWRLGDLPEEHSDTVGLSVLVPGNLQVGHRITNTAWISAPGLIAPVRDRAIVVVGQAPATGTPTSTSLPPATGTRTTTPTPTVTPDPSTASPTPVATDGVTPTSSFTPATPSTAVPTNAASATTTPKASDTPAASDTPPSGTPTSTRRTPGARTETPTPTPTPQATVYLPVARR